MLLALKLSVTRHPPKQKAPGIYQSGKCRASHCAIQRLLAALSNKVLRCSLLAEHGTYASTAAAARMKQRTAMAAAFILANVVTERVIKS